MHFCLSFPSLSYTCRRSSGPSTKLSNGMERCHYHPNKKCHIAPYFLRCSDEDFDLIIALFNRLELSSQLAIINDQEASWTLCKMHIWFFELHHTPVLFSPLAGPLGTSLRTCCSELFPRQRQNPLTSQNHACFIFCCLDLLHSLLLKSNSTNIRSIAEQVISNCSFWMICLAELQTTQQLTFK